MLGPRVTDTLCFLSAPFIMPLLRNVCHRVPSSLRVGAGKIVQHRCLASLKDAGYSFEDYSLKRASFEPSPSMEAKAQSVPWPNYYSSSSLDRDSKLLLRDEAALHAAVRDENSRLIFVWRGRNFFRKGPNADYEAVKFRASECTQYLDDPQSVIIHLGLQAGVRFFAVDVSHLPQYPATDGLVIEQLRSMGGMIDPDHDAGILAFARGMSVWHRTERFCSNCGSGNLVPTRAGASRACTSCKQQFYPRIDPSIIALITARGGEFGLFGRKAIWPSGRYSLLAGFAEMGEALEETVLREVFEESGVRVRPDSVRFASSQTWPFPRSLMIGFVAEAVEEGSTNGQLPRVDVDKEEMDDVRWLSRDEVRRSLAAAAGEAVEGEVVPDFSIPGRAAIAHRLIMDWLHAAPH